MGESSPISGLNRREIWKSSLLNAAVILLAFSSVSLFTPVANAVSFIDRVERVIDGDTIIASSAGRVRFIGMNTPETVSQAQREEGRPPDCYGPEASAYTKKMLPKGTVVRIETDEEPKDQYGRTLGYVFRQPDNTFINGELVKEGFAYAKSYKPNVKYDTILRQYQEEAKAVKRGLWSECEVGGARQKTFSDAIPDITTIPNPKKQNALENPGDVKNCKDFKTYAEAKAWYDKYFNLYGDVARLDGDGDGIPCESLLPKDQRKVKN